MKVFVAGATGVLGRATVPRLVAAGHEVRGAARSPEKADQLRAPGRRAGHRRPVRPGVGARRGRRLPGRRPHGHQHPAAHEGVEGRRVGDQRPPPPRGHPGHRRRVPRRRRRGAREGDGVVLLRGRRRRVDRRGLADRAPGRSARRRSTPRTPRSPSPATAAAASCCGSASSTRHDARAIDEYLKLAKTGFGPMIGAADGWRASIHVDDAATAVVAALDAPAGAYNVADEPITNGEWNAAFADAFGFKKLRATPRPAMKLGGKKVSVLGASRRIDSSRFREATGWAPALPRRHGRPQGGGRRAPGGRRHDRASARSRLVVIAAGTVAGRACGPRSPRVVLRRLPRHGPGVGRRRRPVQRAPRPRRRQPQPRRWPSSRCSALITGSTLLAQSGRRRGPALRRPAPPVPRHPPRPLRRRRQGRRSIFSLSIAVLAAVLAVAAPTDDVRGSADGAP